MTVVVTTSWDDGNKLDLRLAQLMEKYGVLGTFYIPESSPYTDCTVDDIRTLAKHHEIGGHTLTHPELATISASKQRDEIIGCKAWLEGILDEEITSFCYPRGSFTSETVKIVEKAGFSYARTVDRFSFSTSGNPYTQATTCQALLLRIDLFAFAKIVGPLKSLGLFSGWLFVAKALFDHTRKTNGVFHLWGHSWEIEIYNLWKDLEELFKYIASFNDVVYKTNGDLLE